MTNKYQCIPCNFATDRQYSYNRHCNTTKHNAKVNGGAPNTTPNNGVIKPKSGVSDGATQCEYCGKIISFKSHKTRHYKTCKERQKSLVATEKDRIIEKLMKENEELKNKEQEYMEFKKKYEEKDTDFQQLEKDYNDILKEAFNAMKETKTVTNITNNTTNQTINMYYIMNNYNDAYNYEDLMSHPLTAEEISTIENMDPAPACVNLITSRCIDNIDIEKRPIHCLDTARHKYLLRTNGNWEIDMNGRRILDGSTNLIRNHFIDRYAKIRGTGNPPEERMKFCNVMKNINSVESDGKKHVLGTIVNKLLVQNVSLVKQ